MQAPGSATYELKKVTINHGLRVLAKIIARARLAEASSSNYHSSKGEDNLANSKESAGNEQTVKD